VFAGLSVLADSGLEFAMRGGDHENGAVGLRGASDHVLDEVAMARRVDDGEVVLGGLELPQRDVDSDTSVPLSLELVQHPRIFERTATFFR
jgi:hypothetical protein